MKMARTVPIYCDVTHACRARPRARHPRHARLSPTMPHSTRAVRGGRGGRRKRCTVTQVVRARALFWAWPNSAWHRVWPRPGGSKRCRGGGGCVFLKPFREPAPYVVGGGRGVDKKQGEGGA